MLLKVFLFLCAIQDIFCVDHELFKLMNEHLAKFGNELDEFKELTRHYYKKEEDCWFCRNLNHSNIVKDVEEFDFIIVGGGTSGSVLANRLSEIPEWKVLLLEAGGPENDISSVPAMYPFLQNSPMNWKFSSTPQKTCCLGNKDSKCEISSGRVLGGTSSINSLVYSRGNHKDYDIWADKGLIGWCWRSVFPYFQKIEDSHLYHYDRKYHRQGGAIWIENFRDQDELLVQSLLDAAHELGIKYVDYNGKNQLGFAHPQVITKRGVRQSTSKGYLEPVLQDRANLVVRPLCQATRILISPHTKQAYGVEFIHDGKIFVVKATKEVIVSAGALNTPKLLMLSGIGPKEEIERHSISCVSDRKVGYHLKDHVKFQGLNFVFNTSHFDKKYHYDEVLDFLRNGKGPLTEIEEVLIGFLKTERSREKEDYPDIEIAVVKSLFNHGYHQINIKEELYDAMYKPLEEKQGFTITIALLHPKSSGKVFLLDKDPLRDPLIDINAFSDEEDEDIETILAGIHLILKLSHTEHFKKLGAYLNHHQVPSCAHHKWLSDAYWKCSIRYLSFSSNRHLGTCKMGLEDDEDAVVDAVLKVFGINGLRVVDSSIIPVTISGDTMGPNIMIAENGANIIKTEWIR